MMIFQFELRLFGFNLNKQLDAKQLEILSNADNKLIELTFKPDGDKATIICGKLESKDRSGYMFIEFDLVEKLYVILGLSNSVQNLEVSGKPEVIILNRKDLLENGYREYELEKGYETGLLCKKIGQINSEEFNTLVEFYQKKDDLDAIYKAAVEQSLFWMHVAYSVARDNPTINNFEFISKFRLIWTAFNPLFDILEKGEPSERKKLIAFADKSFVIEYINSEVKPLLSQLANAELTLQTAKETLEVSKELNLALLNNDKAAIAKNSILCLYAIRNVNIHGDTSEGINLCRVGFEILNPLIKITIRNAFA